MAKLCQCGAKSVPGLVSGVALCQRHYNALMFGDPKSAEHLEAVTLMHKGPLVVVKEDPRLKADKKGSAI